MSDKAIYITSNPQSLIREVNISEFGLECEQTLMGWTITAKAKYTMPEDLQAIAIVYDDERVNDE